MPARKVFQPSFRRSDGSPPLSLQVARQGRPHCDAVSRNSALKRVNIGPSPPCTDSAPPSLGALWGGLWASLTGLCVCVESGVFFPLRVASVSVALIWKSRNKGVVTVTLSRALLPLLGCEAGVGGVPGRPVPVQRARPRRCPHARDTQTCGCCAEAPPPPAPPLLCLWRVWAVSAPLPGDSVRLSSAPGSANDTSVTSPRSPTAAGPPAPPGTAAESPSRAPAPAGLLQAPPRLCLRPFSFRARPAPAALCSSRKQTLERPPSLHPLGTHLPPSLSLLGKCEGRGSARGPRVCPLRHSPDPPSLGRPPSLSAIPTLGPSPPKGTVPRSLPPGLLLRAHCPVSCTGPRASLPPGPAPPPPPSPRHGDQCVGGSAPWLSLQPSGGLGRHPGAP